MLTVYPGFVWLTLKTSNCSSTPVEVPRRHSAEIYIQGCPLTLLLGCGSKRNPMMTFWRFSLLASLVGSAIAATPAQWRSQSIYFMLTDRFARTDGSTSAICDTSARVCRSIHSVARDMTNFILRNIVAGPGRVSRTKYNPASHLAVGRYTDGHDSWTISREWALLPFGSLLSPVN